MKPEKALQKMMASCARREYCSWDVRQKLRRFDLTPEDVDGIITKLEDQKFIDNERFVKAFVKDKMQFNSWGRTKIRYQLQMKQISSDLINEALTIIKDDPYQEKLERILKKKLSELVPVEDKWAAKTKLIRHAASKGFEPDLIYKTIDSLMGEIDY